MFSVLNNIRSCDIHGCEYLDLRPKLVNIELYSFKILKI
jgi:hypothetical protein